MAAACNKHLQTPSQTQCLVPSSQLRTALHQASSRCTGFDHATLPTQVSNCCPSEDFLPAQFYKSHYSPPSHFILFKLLDHVLPQVLLVFMLIVVLPAFPVNDRILDHFITNTTTVYCIIVVLLVIHCVAILFLITVDVNVIRNLLIGHMRLRPPAQCRASTPRGI